MRRSNVFSFLTLAVLLMLLIVPNGFVFAQAEPTFKTSFDKERGVVTIEDPRAGDVGTREASVRVVRNAEEAVRLHDRANQSVAMIQEVYERTGSMQAAISALPERSIIAVRDAGCEGDELSCTNFYSLDGQRLGAGGDGDGIRGEPVLQNCQWHNETIHIDSVIGTVTIPFTRNITTSQVVVLRLDVLTEYTKLMEGVCDVVDSLTGEVLDTQDATSSSSGTDDTYLDAQFAEEMLKHLEVFTNWLNDESLERQDRVVAVRWEDSHEDFKLVFDITVFTGDKKVVKVERYFVGDAEEPLTGLRIEGSASAFPVR